MATFTTNYNFTLPAVNDPIDEDIWGGQLNGNWTSIDALLKTATDFNVNTAETADFTVIADDRNTVTPVDASAGAVTVNVTSAATLGNGFTFVIVATDTTNDITIDPNGSETINGAATLTISQDYDSVIVFSDGTNLVAIPVVAFSITNNPSETPTTSDEVAFADVDDSNNTKKTTIGDILGLATPSIVQIVEATKTDTATTTSTSFVDVGLTATITPTSASNSILIMAFFNATASASATGVFVKVVRDSTDILVADAAGSRARAAFVGATAETGTNINSGTIVKLDSPATTSPIDYKLQWSVGGGTGYFNRTVSDGNSATVGRAASSILAIEIGS